MSGVPRTDEADSREGYVPVAGGALYYREVGRGQPVVILHGGPDFDHRYLLPEMDRLADAFRLIYYDQRGRGRSADGVQPEDVSMASEMEDLDDLRRHVGLESVALLGHSWGGLLALEYAIRHPEHVSHLVLMNTAPASHADLVQFRQGRRTRHPEDVEELSALSSTAGYADGDPDAVSRYYRVHFRRALRRPEDFERLISRLSASFTRDAILKGRAIEERLVSETWASSDYDLCPKLGRLRIPTLVIHGDADLFPVACAAHIAQAISGGRLVVLRDCGHFSYLERPDEGYREVVDFISGG